MAPTRELTDLGHTLTARFTRLHELLDELESHDRRIHAELTVIRRVFDASGEAMFALDLAGKIVQCNAHALRILGLEVDRVRGQSLSHFLKGGRVSQVWSAIQGCLKNATKTVDRTEMSAELVRQNTSQTVPCRITLSPVPFDEGEPIVSVVVRPST